MQAPVYLHLNPWALPAEPLCRWNGSPARCGNKSLSESYLSNWSSKLQTEVRMVTTPIKHRKCFQIRNRDWNDLYANFTSKVWFESKYWQDYTETQVRTACTRQSRRGPKSGQVEVQQGVSINQRIISTAQTDGIPETIQVPYTLGDTRNFSLKWYFW